MEKGLLKLLMLSMMLIPSVLTFAQLGQNGEKMPFQQKQIVVDQHVTQGKSVTSIFTEDFSGGTVPPADWTIIGGGEPNWNWYDTNNAGGTTPEAAFGWGPPMFNGNSKMVTPVIATSGASTLVLEFHSFVWDYAGSGYSYKIETTSDGGTTWNEVWSISPTGDIPAELVTFVIDNEDVGSDDFQFALTFDGNTTQINYWYFDDFVLSTSTADVYSVTFNVKDEDNAPVEGAQVNMQSGGTKTTDATGEVVFENVLSGDYNWWAVATGLSLEEGTVTVTDADVTVDVALSVSSELLSEHFAGGTFPTEGWSISGDGQSNWNQVNSNYAGLDYPELRFTSSPVFDGNSKFVTPEVVTLGYTDLFLDFNYFLEDNSGSDCSIKVETTSDGGTTWTEVWSVSPTGDMGPLSQTLLISTDDVGSELFQLAFTVDGNSADIANWYIDDVVLTTALQYDAAVAAIEIPSLVAPGIDVIPSVEVVNDGAQNITFDVTVDFTDGTNSYSETITVINLDPLETEIVVFPTWNSIAGSYDGEVYVTLAGDENIENDEISFGMEVASGLFPKKPLYEIFTSSTCPPCVFANEALDALLDENPGEYSLIKYQVNWPGSGDPYYTEEAGVRSGYYAVSSVPSLHINSESFSPAVNITQADFDAYQDVETALQIEITKAEVDDENMVSIVADLVSAVNYPAGLSAYIVVLEKVTYDNVGTNGETEFHNVMMKILPDASGETLGDLTTGVSTTISGSYDMNLTFMETNENLAVVVFVQDNSDKSIVQSAMMDVTLSTGVENSLSSQENIKLYPNPASDMIMIESALAIQKIELFNQVGQLVKVENTNDNALNLNLTDLNSGVYFVKVFSQGRVITKRFVVK